MAESVSRETVEHVFANLAKSDSTEFSAFFAEAREIFPQGVKRACLRYLAEFSVEPLAKPISAWVISVGGYFPLLVDPQFLSRENRGTLATLMRAQDPRFFSNFGRLTMAGASGGNTLYEALQLLEGVEQPNILLPWLLGLTHHNDAGVRSKAAKLVCKLQSNPELIQRQLQSADSRVRANAVEALWGSGTEEAVDSFRRALSDSNHRVVVNALIGLHLQNCGDDIAFRYLLRFAEDSSDLFRLGAVWAFGYLEDRRAIPALQRLSIDPLESIRTKAASVLAALLGETGAEAKGAHEHPLELA